MFRSCVREMMLSNIPCVDNNSAGAFVAKQRIDEAPFWWEAATKRDYQLAIWKGIFAKIAEVKERKMFATLCNGIAKVTLSPCD